MPFVTMLNEFNDNFEDMCRKRHEMGEEKYGAFKFMEVDSLEEAAEELIDLANYARYSFIRIRLIQAYLRQQTEEQPDLIGMEGFKKS